MRCLYSKLENFGSTGAVPLQESTNFRQVRFLPHREEGEATESKIPPFTRFARPCGGHKARAERGNGGIFDSVASPTSTSFIHGTFGALRAPKVAEFGQK